MLVIIVSAHAMVQALMAQGILLTSIIREEFNTSVADATWGAAVRNDMGSELLHGLRL